DAGRTPVDEIHRRSGGPQRAIPQKEKERRSGFGVHWDSGAHRDRSLREYSHSVLTLSEVGEPQLRHSISMFDAQILALLIDSHWITDESRCLPLFPQEPALGSHDAIECYGTSNRQPSCAAISRISQAGS